jgi:molybdate transport system substrate-binding protein
VAGAVSPILVSSLGAGPGDARLSVYAAASLAEVFQRYDPDGKYNFGSSSALETQIRNGAPADVFASASAVNTRRLYRAGLVERPVEFAANRLVLIVPRSNPAGIESVFDLARSKAKVVVAAASVPVGAYTRQLLRKLGLRSAVLARVVSNEPDVKGVVGKIALGQGDAGFVYATDVAPVADRVKAIALPARAQPRIRYELAVVSSSPNGAAARAWVKGLLGARGRTALVAAGFLPVADG